MKKAKKIIFPIIIILIWVVAIVVFKNLYFDNGGQETIRLNNIHHRSHDEYYKLSKTEKYFYNALVTKLTNLADGSDSDYDLTISASSIGIEGNLSEKIPYFNALLVEEAVRKDFPYYDCLIGEFGYYLPDDDNDTTVVITLGTDREVLSKYRKAYSLAYDLANMVLESSEEEKMEFFKQFLADKSNNDETDDELRNSIIYAFDENDGTHMSSIGLAKAFKMLCDFSNVEGCYYFTGTANDVESSWNKYLNKGEFYLIDLANLDDNDNLYMVEVENKTYTVNNGSYNITYIEK